MTFRPDLQGLRAVAVSLVVLAHAGIPWFEGGFVGVDVFFVLSGYLITGFLLREFEETHRIALLEFYARRLKRLLPALITMVAVTAGLGFFLLSGFEARSQLASAPFAATWTSNLYFSFTTLNYFDELATRDLFLHTWSLGVEEQFYLLWPLLLLTLLLIGPVGRLIRSRRARLIVLGIVALASLVFSLSLSTSQWPHAAFYLMPARIWQFALGAMIYVAFAPGFSRLSHYGEASSLGPPAGWLTLWLGLLLIIGSAMGFHANLVYPGFWVIFPSVGTALVLAAGYGLSAGRTGPLAFQGLVWLGDRSYSWYLWHWPILILGFSLGFEGQPLPTLGLILLSLLAAILSYRYVELPFWKGRFSGAGALRILLVGILATGVLVAGLVHALRSPIISSEEFVDPSMQWRMDVPDIYRMPCDAWYHHARVEPCVFGDSQAKKTVVLLGDSIGVQWFSMVPAIFQEPEWVTIVLTKSACAMVDEDYVYTRIGQVYTVCTEWRHAVLDLIALHKPNVVILGSAFGYDFSESQWVEGTARVLERLSQAAESIFLIPGTPSLGFDGPGCAIRNLSAEGLVGRNACLAPDRLKRVEPVTHFLNQAAARFPNVHLFDLNDLVCPDGICAAASAEGIVVFRDGQHLTDSFVRSKIPIIRERLENFQMDLTSHEHQGNSP